MMRQILKGRGRGVRLGYAGRRLRLRNGTALAGGVMIGLGALLAVTQPAAAECVSGPTSLACSDTGANPTYSPLTFAPEGEWVVTIGQDNEAEAVISVDGVALTINDEGHGGEVIVREDSLIETYYDAYEGENHHGIELNPGSGSYLDVNDTTIHTHDDYEFVVDGTIDTTGVGNNGDADGIHINGDTAWNDGENYFPPNIANDIDITISETGEIIAADSAIYVDDFTGTLTIDNAGSLISEGFHNNGTSEYPQGSAAIYVDYAGDYDRSQGANVQITNSGLISGAGGYFGYDPDGPIVYDGAGIDIENTGYTTIANSGAIYGGTDAVSVYGSTEVDITNTLGAMTEMWMPGIVGGESGIVAQSIYDFNLDNRGGLVLGLDDEGVRVLEVYSDELHDGDVVINNGGGWVDGEDEEAPTASGGGLIAGYWDGLDIYNVSGDVTINNNGSADEEAETTFAGGLIVGVNGSGVQLEDIRGSVDIDNSNTLVGAVSEYLLYALSGFDMFEGEGEGSFEGTNPAGILGWEDGVEIYDVDGSVVIDNRSGQIIAVDSYYDYDDYEEDTNAGIDVSGVDGVTIGSYGDVDYIRSLAFVLKNGGSELNPEIGGLIYGRYGVELDELYGTVIVENGNGTIYGTDEGLSVSYVEGGDVFISNSQGGKIEGEDDAISLSDVMGANYHLEGLVGGSVIIENAGVVLSHDDDAIDIHTARTIDIVNAAGGYLIGDSDVIEINDTPDGLIVEDGEARRATIIANAGIMASDDLPYFGWLSNEETSDVMAKWGMSVENQLAFASELSGFRSFALNGGELDLEALYQYEDAAEDDLINSSSSYDDYYEEEPYSSGATEIVNTGFMAGQIRLEGENQTDDQTVGTLGNLVVNNGTWFVTGENEASGLGRDVFENGANGWIQAAFEWDDGEDTDFYVDEFRNSGLLSMLDGNTGDDVEIYGNYVGGGVIGLDVNFDELTSDSVYVDSAISSQTGLILRKVAGTGFGTADNTIDVVGYGSGEFEAPSSDAFYIASNSDNFFVADDMAYVGDGVVAWYLHQDAEDQEFELKSVWSPGSQKATNVVTGAQTLFYDAISVVEDHFYGGQAGETGGSGADVTYVSEDGRYAKRGAFWMKGSGRWTDQDRQLTLGGVPFDTSTEQTTYALMAGADFSTDSNYRFGVFGGYLTSDVDFNVGGTAVEYEGGTVGAYGAYNDGRIFADVTGKVDFLNAHYVFSTFETDANILSYGLQANAGYRIQMGTSYFEPLVSGVVMKTDAEDFAVGAGSVSFDDGLSARLGAGARIGTQIASGGMITDVSLTGRVWNEFAGDNTVTVTDGGAGVSTFSDDPDGLFGEVTGTLTVKPADGAWSGFVSGNGMFGKDYRSYGASVGLRVAF
jgi:hypothetical protein